MHTRSRIINIAVAVIASATTSHATTETATETDASVAAVVVTPGSTSTTTASATATTTTTTTHPVIGLARYQGKDVSTADTDRHSAGSSCVFVDRDEKHGERNSTSNNGHKKCGGEKVDST